MAVALGLASAFVLTLVKEWQEGCAAATRALHAVTPSPTPPPPFNAAHDKIVGYVRTTRHPESHRGRHSGYPFQNHSLRRARGGMDRGRRGKSGKSKQRTLCM
jgi:hypothetical protein